METELLGIVAANLHDYGLLADIIQVDHGGRVETLRWNNRMEQYHATAQPYPDTTVYTPEQIYNMADTFLGGN